MNKNLHKKIVKKKQVSFRHVLKRFILFGIVFYAALVAWQALVFLENLKDDRKMSNPIALLLFLVIVFLWIFCYFEIRLLIDQNQRFLGYKAYILFYYKLLSIPLSVFTSVFCFHFAANIFILIMLQMIWFTIYSILITLFFYPYKKYINEKDFLLTLSYQVRVKKWYKEDLYAIQLKYDKVNK